MEDVRAGNGAYVYGVMSCLEHCPDCPQCSKKWTGYYAGDPDSFFDGCRSCYENAKAQPTKNNKT